MPRIYPAAMGTHARVILVWQGHRLRGARRRRLRGSARTLITVAAAGAGRHAARGVTPRLATRAWLRECAEEPAQVGCPDGASGLQIARENAGLREDEAAARGLQENPFRLEFPG